MQWALDEFLEGIEVPLSVVLSQHDLRVKQERLEGLVVHLHPQFHLLLLNGSLTATYGVFRRVRPAACQCMRSATKGTRRHTVDGQWGPP